MYMMARYFALCSNRFFRICRAAGIFIAGNLRRAALQHGMDMNDTWPQNKILYLKNLKVFLFECMLWEMVALQFPLEYCFF